MIPIRAAAPALIALLFPAAAQGQRANENVLRSAEDAFGSSIGRETIGLYNSGDVRGFSPSAAGNLRLEGLYIDAVTDLGGRLARGSTIRVGISAQGYPFPAPTGIADYRLRLPGDARAITAIFGTSTNGDVNGDIDMQLPIVPGRLGFSGGLSLSHDESTYSEPGRHAGMGALLRWTPSPKFEIIPFWKLFMHRDDPAQPRFVTAGHFLPPRIDRHLKLTQDWARNNADEMTYGLITRIAAGGGYRLEGGLFRSSRDMPGSFSDLFVGVSSDGLAAQHRIVASPASRSASTSGELRLTREIEEGPRRHRLLVALRGRDQDRLYGGSSVAQLGPDSILAPRAVPERSFTFGDRSRDHIRQLSAGIAYHGLWPGKGELTLGVQRSDYRKETRIPGRTDPDVKDSPWLFNGALSVRLSEALALYGGFTRGLEESPVAPEVAVNLDEAPPAVRTLQYDGGLRWAITPKLRLVAGLFNVEKPYFNLDPARVYRRLGEVRHRGAEFSLSGEPLPHLNVVAGLVLLNAKVRGEAVAAGLTGPRPVDSAKRTIIFNAEYALQSVPGLSFDVGLESSGKRIANVANSLVIPPTENVTIGLRLRRTIAGTPMTLRAQVSNLFDAFFWEVRGSNAFFYESPRRGILRLTMDL